MIKIKRTTNCVIKTFWKLEGEKERDMEREENKVKHEVLN